MIDKVLEFAKLDDDSIDEISDLISAANIYMTNAGIPNTENMKNNELYKLAIKVLVTHWHENREPIGKADKLAYSLDSMIAQLKYCEV